MPFYVEKPADKWGNTAYGRRVFEGHIETEADNDRPKMVFEHPDKWPWVYADSYGGFIETAGPARPLTWEEWCQLVGFTPI